MAWRDWIGVERRAELGGFSPACPLSWCLSPQALLQHQQPASNTIPPQAVLIPPLSCPAVALAPSLTLSINPTLISVGTIPSEPPRQTSKEHFNDTQNAVVVCIRHVCWGITSLGVFFCLGSENTCLSATQTDAHLDLVKSSRETTVWYESVSELAHCLMYISLSSTEECKWTKICCYFKYLEAG